MEKPLQEMTDDELRDEMARWSKMVEEAGGFASAMEAAKGCKRVEREAQRRGVPIENQHPICKG